MSGYTLDSSSTNFTKISQNAVSLLRNIYAVVKTGNFGCVGKDDVSSVKSLLSDLKSLNKMRCCAYQVLETESIKVAALRLKLQQFKEQKVTEIFDKRNLVRMLNENEFRSLQDSLNSIKCTYEKGEFALQQLTHTLELLRLNELKSNAENSVTVDTLNNCLDNKANKQIFLNQKLEEIQMTEFKEKEVQKMLDQLNSEITEERRNAVRKIIKLEEETNKVKKALGIQTAKNEKLEKPHKKVSEELRGHRFEEYSLSQGVEELQSNIREYQIKTSMLLNTIERKDNEIQAAKEKRNTIQRGLEKLLKEHKESLANMRNQLKEIEKSQEASELNIKAYEEKKETLTANEKRYETEKEKLQSIFKKKESGVMKIENEYMAKAEATAQLQEEIDEMVEKTKNLNLSSRCLIDNLKQQAETMKGHLANEQKERVQVQRTQRKLHRQIASFNDEQSLCVRKYHRRINEAKSKLLFLDKEKIRLDEESKKNQEKANEIQSKINTEIAQHDSERLKCAEKIASLSKMLDDSNGICKQLNKEIQDELPVLEDLNSKVKKNEQVESETKSLQVEMNQTIRSLESEIRQLNDANKTLDFDLKQLRKQIMTLESDYKKKLADQIDLLNSTESNIYTNVCRLNTVNIENARLDGGILKQEQSIQEICSDWEKILRIKSKLRNRYRSLTDIIENDHLSEQRLIQSSIEFYKYLIEEKMKFISTECCQRDQLFKQILPELWRLFNEINQFFEIGKSISQQIVSSKVDKMLALPSSQNVDVHQENNYTNNKKNDNNNNDGDNNDDVRKCQN